MHPHTSPNACGIVAINPLKLTLAGWGTKNASSRWSSPGLQEDLGRQDGEEGLGGRGSRGHGCLIRMTTWEEVQILAADEREGGKKVSGLAPCGMRENHQLILTGGV